MTSRYILATFCEVRSRLALRRLLWNGPMVHSELCRYVCTRKSSSQQDRQYYGRNRFIKKKLDSNNNVSWYESLPDTRNDRIQRRERKLQMSVVAKLHNDIFESGKYKNSVFLRSCLPSESNVPSERSIQNMHVKELLDCLTQVAKSISDTRLLCKYLKVFEDNCLKHISDLNMDSQLYVCDVFICCDYRAEIFFNTILQEFENKWQMLTISPQNLTQLMFIIAVNGSCSNNILALIEQYFSENLDKFSIKEISVICLGFFRAKSSIKTYSLLNGIAERTLKDFQQLHIEALNNIFKLFRHAGFMKPSFYEDLGNIMCQNQIPTAQVHTGIMQITNLYASVRVYHDALLNTAHHSILRKFEKLENPGKLFIKSRAKDIAKMIWAFATFGYNVDKKIIELLIADFERRVVIGEIDQFPEALVDFLLALTYLGHFPDKLLECLFCEKFLKLIWAHHLRNKKEDVYLIHRSVCIESSFYNTRHILKDSVDMLTKNFNVLNLKAYEFELSKRMGLKQLWETLVTVAGEESVQCGVILTHIKTASIDIDASAISGSYNGKLDFSANEDAVNSAESSKPVTGGVFDQLVRESTRNVGTLEEMTENRNENPIFLPACPETSTNKRRVVIEVHGFNQYTLGQPKLLGLHAMKLRQLRKLGYDTILIPPGLGRQICENMDSEERRKFVQRKLLPFFVGRKSRS